MFNFYELTIQFHHPLQWKFLFLWQNKSLVLSLPSSLQVEFDSLEKEQVMVWHNPVRKLILTQWHNVVQASMDSVYWKCKQACICLPAKEKDKWDLVSIEKTKSTLDNLMIHVTMNEFVYFSNWFYSIHFTNISNFILNLILYILQHFQFIWTKVDTLVPRTEKWVSCA